MSRDVCLARATCDEVPLNLYGSNLAGKRTIKLVMPVLSFDRIKESCKQQPSSQNHMSLPVGSIRFCVGGFAAGVQGNSDALDCLTEVREQSKQSSMTSMNKTTWIHRGLGRLLHDLACPESIRVRPILLARTIGMLHAFHEESWQRCLDFSESLLAAKVSTTAYLPAKSALVDLRWLQERWWSNLLLQLV